VTLPDSKSGAADPDRLIKWFVSVVVVGAAVNLLSGFVLAHKWAWLPPTIFVTTLMLVAPTAGLLRRERHGATRWAQGVALLALAAYVAVATWGWLTNWSIRLMILSVGFLWAAGVVLMWSTLKRRRTLSLIAIGTSLLLLGSMAMLLGGGGLVLVFEDRAMPNADSPLIAVALTLVGIAANVGGSALLLNRLALGGAALMIGGHAVVLFGFAPFRSQLAWFLLAGVALVLGGIAFLLNRPRWGGIAFLPLGLASSYFGFLFLFVDVILGGVELMLLGVAFLMLGVALILQRSRLVKVAFLALAIPSLVIGVQYLLREGTTLFGLGALMFGIASLVCGSALVDRPKVQRGMVAWLTRRDDAVDTAVRPGR
jgi:hypothetical protein